MTKVLSLLLLFCFPVFSDNYGTPLQHSARVEQDILNGKLAARTEEAMTNLIGVAYGELRKKGHKYEAETMQNEWYSTYRQMFRNYANAMRDIGDHKPLSQWLADKYTMLEMVLGVTACKQTHLSDIKTFNFTIPVVFRPCTFPMDAIGGERINEYRNHFSEGQTYYGLVPVTTYWVVYGVTTAATMGGGFMFVAGLAGSLAEKLIAVVTPKMSDKVYNKFCGGE